MDVKLGYKKTEVGVIPEDWDVSPVRQKGEVLTGKALAVNAPGAQRPYLRTKNVFDGRIDLGDVLTMPMTDEQFTQFQLRCGDVLLNEGQSLELVGRCAIYQDEYLEPCAIQNALLRFRAGADVSAKFASYLFRHCQQTGVFARIALQTTSVAHLGGSRFERLRLPWPTESEQHAIAATLSDVDALLAKLDALVAKKRDLKQAAMHQLLTGLTRLPGFAGEWKVRPLSSVVTDLEAGVSVNSVEYGRPLGSGAPCILKTSAIFGGDFDPEECKLIDPRDLSRARLSPKRDTIIISRMNTPNLVGEVGYVSEDFPTLCLPDRLWMTRFAPGADICARWLAYVMSSAQIKDTIKGLATGTSGTMKNIGKSVLLALQLRFPTGAEQTAIAAILSDMDAELLALEARRDKTRALKQGMMQELLTGRIRLV